MHHRTFGKTTLTPSEIGFGAWGIGGPAMAGDVPIGWGQVNDEESKKALQKAFDLGITFYDTADFYGLGHSEKLIGEVLGNKQDIIIATKVGHKLSSDNSILLDYSKDHILKACEGSLKRLKRECIDYYQLHSAKLEHLKEGECIDAMETLRQAGKIKYWGVSLNTFDPYPEGEYLIDNQLGDGFQVVFNIINQRAFRFVQQAHQAGYGIIARMPLQFGLLTGKFTRETKFPQNDHRHFRLTPSILDTSLDVLKDVWPIAEKYYISKTSLSLGFILSFKEISTVIPGIKTTKQAIQNTKDIIKLDNEDQDFLIDLYEKDLSKLVDMMEREK